MNPEVLNALWGLGWSIGICAVVWFLAWRKTSKRNHYLPPPKHDDRDSIGQFKRMHRP